MSRECQQQWEGRWTCVGGEGSGEGEDIREGGAENRGLCLY